MDLSLTLFMDPQGNTQSQLKFCTYSSIHAYVRSKEKLSILSKCKKKRTFVFDHRKYTEFPEDFRGVLELLEKEEEENKLYNSS